MAGKSTVQAVPVDEKIVQEIINSRSVHTFFQPVISISTKSIIGFEAFSRGRGGTTEVEPCQLFHCDLKPNTKIDVDRLCREKSLGRFKTIHDAHKGMLLFMNVNADILPLVEVGSEVLKRQVADMGIAPSSVVIESPLHSSGFKECEEFARLHKEYGFKLCLDNCSADESVCQALFRLRPDFIKINGSFFAEETRKEYSSKALEMMLKMAEEIGATVIAQGVEKEDDSIRLMTAGVHLQQGYYYTKDEDKTSGDPAKMFFKKIIDTYDKFVLIRRAMVKRKKGRFESIVSTVSSACSKFAAISENKFEEGCKTVVRNADSVVSLFVLGESGVQLTSRVHMRSPDGRLKSSKVLGFEKGVDHSIKDYILYLNMGYEKFVTKPFLSPYTGETVCFVSRTFYNSEGLRYILCVEILYPE